MNAPECVDVEFTDVTRAEPTRLYAREKTEQVPADAFRLLLEAMDIHDANLIPWSTDYDKVLVEIASLVLRSGDLEDRRDFLIQLAALAMIGARR